MNPLRKLLPAILVVGGMAVAGCMDSRPSLDTTNEEATLKGTVTIAGKTAKKGKVQFDPSNYQRKNATMREVDINPDGTYEVKTLVGINSIKVVGRDAEKAGAAYTTVDYDVPSGGGTYDINISP